MPNNQDQKLEKIRHSLSHIMAGAVMKMFPGAKLGIGPTIADGFYYDFELDRPLVPQDLKRIEKEMRRTIGRGIAFKKEEVPVTAARKRLKGQPYKKELVDELKEKGEKKVSFYESGDFVDLCAGPHVKSAKDIPLNAFKLTKTAGAYWKGDENNKMLQRIYGVAFKNKEQLDEYLEKEKEAEKRDHRKLGQELELFTFSEQGPGMPIFLDKGTVIWNELVAYWREMHRAYGYEEIRTPILFKSELWKISGHWDHYRENMYTSEIDKNTYVLKPMNCPGGMIAYKTKTRSYREFPLKMGEIGHVHRHEKSGVLSGLFRVRSFHQDDAHLFMTRKQAVSQVVEVLEIVDRMYSTFGLKYHLELSTRPKKSIGTDTAWKESTASLEDALKKTGKKFEINEGEGAFYGPKIDVHLEDALGRTWQCATIQVDMSLPERFDLEYVDQKGRKQRPVVIHRVVYGALERFFGVLVEHYAGAFPPWLAPVQVSVASVGSAHKEFCQELAREFERAGLRPELQTENETIGNKIRLAERQKVPYMLVIGDKEMKSKNLNVRVRGKKGVAKMPKEKFIAKLQDEIGSKSPRPA